MSADAVARELSWTSPLTWISLVVLVALFAIGVRAVLAPARASVGFGIPLAEGESPAYVQAFGARNVGLGLFAVLAIVLDQGRSVGVFFFCGAVIALIDAYIVSRHLGFGRSTARPAIIALVLAVLGGVMLR